MAQKLPKAGFFVSIEGGDGAGKTTLLKGLHKVLVERGGKTVMTREPGGSKLGELIRQWLLNHDFDCRIGQKAELLLFLAARAQHIEELIQPALAAGSVVLCDRFNDSTIAYQAFARGQQLELVKQLCALTCENIVPALTFYLDIDPEAGLKRALERSKGDAQAGQPDRMEREKLAFHSLVRQGFLSLAQQEPQRIHLLDATLSIEELQAKALHILEANWSVR